MVQIYAIIRIHVKTQNYIYELGKAQRNVLDDILNYIHDLGLKPCKWSCLTALGRARPDWAYEFPDQTGPDTQICRTGPARPD